MVLPLENKALTADVAPVRVTLRRPWDGHQVGETVLVPGNVATALLAQGIAG